MKTPKEIYFGKRPNVYEFRIFGSSIYFHVTRDANKKIESKTELDIFVGYTDTPHNYRVYLLTSRMSVVCRDVRFDKEKATRDSLERDLEINSVEEILSFKFEESQIDVE